MDPGATVLAIVREVCCLEVIESALIAEGIRVVAVEDAESAWSLIRQTALDAVILDAAVVQGTQFVRRVADWDPGLPVVLLTDLYDAESAVDSIRYGACDCLRKPLSAVTIQTRVREILADSRRRRETQALDGRLLESFRFHGMVGRSPQMLETFARIKRVAPHYRVALISGATGTGKELVAHALHALSPVASRRMAVCNCSAIVETLFESELFGHVKGAFTGAAQDRVGLFEYAHGGTVFLDEIADMPLATQSKLLRVVQSGEFQRVGSPEVRKVDVRLVAASNRDMRALVAANLFREDLYYRLAMVELRLPSLAERREDLPLLERHFVEKFSSEYGKRIGGISRRAQSAMARHDWPGNVREMENVLGHACMMADAEFIDTRDLPEYLRAATSSRAIAAQPDLISLGDLEQRYTRHVLQRVGGNKLHAAKVLGISRATLYRILRDGARETTAPPLEFLTSSGAVPRIRIQ